mmetsp:Transcript_5039/g.9021  ORF Transcript_5039/g.9021 Transcript_5039/m.9021 type:complete len:98 (+) Transcript_5039:1941-2234(+)
MRLSDPAVLALRTPPPPFGSPQDFRLYPDALPSLAGDMLLVLLKYLQIAAGGVHRNAHVASGWPAGPGKPLVLLYFGRRAAARAVSSGCVSATAHQN